MPEKGPSLQPIKEAFGETRLLELVRKDRVIHIAGTNGKGTTAKTLQRLLSAQGLKVGLYTSPHLVDTTERIVVNDSAIAPSKLVSLMEKYYDVILKHNLSHFETLTLFAVDYFFNDQNVDWAVFEIGLGGTWDATNAIPHSTAVITALGLDHQHILGDTIEEIAKNKFGIIHEENEVFHLPFPKHSLAELAQSIVIKQKAREWTVAPPKFTVSSSQTQKLPIYTLQTPWGDTELSLPGARAAENMWLALNVFSALGFSAKEGLKTLSQIHWPARMTPLPIKANAPVYLSGDHNIQGIESLIEILSQTHYEKLFVVLGLSKNRAHAPFVEKLTSLPRMRLILTSPTFRGVTPEDPSLSIYPFFSEPKTALEFALKEVQHGDLVVVTGSLYLCGDILRN